MKLTVLSENHALCPTLAEEYGLSIYLEKGKTRLLFDTGTGGACFKNAGALGIEAQVQSSRARSRSCRYI